MALARGGVRAVPSIPGLPAWPAQLYCIFLPPLGEQKLGFEQGRQPWRVVLHA